jgi:type IV fimbrial biogenesis protein FimT
MKTAGKHKQFGITTLEAVMALAITTATLGSTLPGFSEMQDRRRLEGAAAQLETEMQFARGLAVTERRAVRFSFQADAAKSCYVIHTGPANGCRCDAEQTACVAGAKEVRTVRFEAGSRLRVTSNSSSMLIDPIKGTVSPTATVKLSNARGDGVNVVINIMGRVRACSPTGMNGQRPC